MSVSLRWPAALGAAALVLLASHVSAQPAGTPPDANQPRVMTDAVGAAAQRLGNNVSVLGRSPLGSGLGYGFDAPPSTAGTPAVNVPQVPPTAAAANPYALSTAPSTNPYMSGAGSLGASGGGAGFAPPVSPYGGLAGMPWWGMGSAGLIGAGPGVGYGAALEGLASLQRAQGQYWKDIVQARLGREQALQANLDTARRRVEFEAWYESMRPTATKMRDREMAADLDEARRTATDTDIQSGRALNTLLRNIQVSGRLNQGQNVPLDEEVLRHVNLSGGTSAGSVGMLKDGVKLPWPDGLQDQQFDEARKRLTRNLRQAVDTLKDKEPIPEALMKDIRGDNKALADKLAESANDLSPAQYVEARRFLNQLNGAIKALADPKVANYFNNTWNARGKSVAEMISHLTREGLTFAPAAPGDEAAYRAVYQALRAFDASLQYAQRTP